MLRTVFDRLFQQIPTSLTQGLLIRFGRGNDRLAPRRRRQALPGIEAVESRKLLSAIAVTTTLNDNNSGNLLSTLNQDNSDPFYVIRLTDLNEPSSSQPSLAGTLLGPDIDLNSPVIMASSTSYSTNCVMMVQGTLETPVVVLHSLPTIVDGSASTVSQVFATSSVGLPNTIMTNAPRTGCSIAILDVIAIATAYQPKNTGNLSQGLAPTSSTTFAVSQAWLTGNFPGNITPPIVGVTSTMVGLTGSTGASALGGTATPVVMETPSTITLKTGKTATFTASATNATKVDWWESKDDGKTWQKVDPFSITVIVTVDVAGGKMFATLTITDGSAHKGSSFRAVFKNGENTAESPKATLNVDSGK